MFGAMPGMWVCVYGQSTDRFRAVFLNDFMTDQSLRCRLSFTTRPLPVFLVVSMQ